MKGLGVAAVIIFALTMVWHRASAGEAQADPGPGVAQTCTPLSDRVTAGFSWTPSGQGPQWLDLSLFDNGFAPGTFINAGPFDAGQSSFTWVGLLPGRPHFFRVNTLTPRGWQPTGTYTLVTGVCHAPSSPPAVVEQRCSVAEPGKVTVTLRWTQGDAGPEWIDLSLFNNGFAPGSFIGAGPLAPGDTTFVWDGLNDDAPHYVRVNTLTSAGWEPSQATVFTTARCTSPLLGNAATFQRTPTFDGSGQAEHPDVVYVPGGWRGYRYWMAFTPYPYGNDRSENPSIAVSNDGVSWLTPPGLREPIIPPPPCDHNSDPDLVYRPDTDELYLYYAVQRRREYCGAGVNSNELRLTTSRDGVHWSSPRTVLSWDLGVAPLYLSPAVVFRDGSFEMWLAGGGGVVHATSGDGVTWSALQPVAIYAAPWHLDVAYVAPRAEYWMLFVDSPFAGAKLMLATSKDGMSWDVDPEPVLVPGTGWDSERIYRATFLYGDDGRFRVWYSARNGAGEWHIGYAEMDGRSVAGLPGG